LKLATSKTIAHGLMMEMIGSSLDVVQSDNPLIPPLPADNDRMRGKMAFSTVFADPNDHDMRIVGNHHQLLYCGEGYGRKEQTLTWAISLAQSTASFAPRLTKVEEIHAVLKRLTALQLVHELWKESRVNISATLVLAKRMGRSRL